MALQTAPRRLTPPGTPCAPVRLSTRRKRATWDDERVARAEARRNRREAHKLHDSNAHE